MDGDARESSARADVKEVKGGQGAALRVGGGCLGTGRLRCGGRAFRDSCEVGA